MNSKKFHAKYAKKDAKYSDLNFAQLCGFTLRTLREKLLLIKRKEERKFSIKFFCMFNSLI